MDAFNFLLGCMCCLFLSKLRKLLETSYVWPTQIIYYFDGQDKMHIQTTQPKGMHILWCTQPITTFNYIFNFTLFDQFVSF